MIELLQRRYEAMTPLKVVVDDVPNSDNEDHPTVSEHKKFDNKS